MTDVVERAKAALEGTTEGPWGTDGELIASELVVERPGVTSYKHAIANMETDYYAEEGADEGETYGDAEPWRPFEQMEADAEFIAEARTLVPELVAEVERLREGNVSLAARIETMIEKGVEEGLGLKSLTVEDGAANLSVTTKGLAEHTVLVMLDGLADMLGDATNYVEFDLRRRGKQPVSVCVRRYAHPTPHELREKAEADNERLRATVERVREIVHEHIPRGAGQRILDALAVSDE